MKAEILRQGTFCPKNLHAKFILGKERKHITILQLNWMLHILLLLWLCYQICVVLNGTFWPLLTMLLIMLNLFFKRLRKLYESIKSQKRDFGWILYLLPTSTLWLDKRLLISSNILDHIISGIQVFFFFFALES